MINVLNEVCNEIKSLTNNQNESEEENEEITIDLFDVLCLCASASRIELFF